MTHAATESAARAAAPAAATRRSGPGEAPVIVVGAGLAGLSTALHLARRQPVLLLAKRRLDDAATAWAQGGIVGVLGADDSVEAHVHDTMAAGAGLVDEAAARRISAASAEAVAWLQAQGVPFTAESGGPLGLHLTREGGHGVRRIAHAADATGAAIHAALLRQVLAHPNIQVRTEAMVVDLITDRHLTRRHLGAAGPADGASADGAPANHAPADDAMAPAGAAPRVWGVYALDLASGRVQALPAQAVVLATGGIGKVYRYTSNPDTATGDGVAMAWRAGCRVANMEFIQFHPTCLYHPQDRRFLITEALRGEGAVLRLPPGVGGSSDAAGLRFMPAHDARAELAPRDIVARAIDAEMKRHGLDHVLLDATALGEAFLKQHFPTIHARCLALGLDIARQPIPVVPAAHYSCGGVVADLAGRTDLPGLHAVGEAACTGLHGANRLASNSLLECVVTGRACAEHLLAEPPRAVPPLPAWDESQVSDADELVVVSHNWDELRLLMWNYVGIVRSTRRLQRAQARIALLRHEIDEYYARFRLTRDLLELRNLVDCAELVVRSALQRHESRGLHHSRDWPDTLPVALATVLDGRHVV
ncbi:L-aspartate oxidase [Aquabacterium sp. OR-4]|uniref:L-aspartate oxidase n=1 Tax=Aquabacterium sp. OR-4 TaxID=2978127 RepID=UPI0028C97737|nr:L-aspartate oxidase [Aquabacterium sp. OR-4]MDT7835609.1 L-aspartate oxidase [Aquabacterium sp. OR-4]